MDSQVTIAAMLVTWAEVELATKLVMETTPQKMAIINPEASTLPRMETKSVQRVDILLIQVAHSKWLETSRSRAIINTISIKPQDRQPKQTVKTKTNLKSSTLLWILTTTNTNWRTRSLEFTAITWTTFNSAKERRSYVNNSSRTTKKIQEQLRTNTIKTTKMISRTVMTAVPEELLNHSWRTRREPLFNLITTIKPVLSQRAQQLHPRLLKRPLQQAVTKKCRRLIDWNKYKTFSSRHGPESALNLPEDLELVPSAIKRGTSWSLINSQRKKKDRSDLREFIRSFTTLRMTIYRYCFQVGRIDNREQPKTSLIRIDNLMSLKLLYSNILRVTRIKWKEASMKT